MVASIDGHAKAACQSLHRNAVYFFSHVLYMSTVAVVKAR